MAGFLTRQRTGRADELWPVLLLLVVVAVPTIGILWFIGIAMENQQLATRQQLTDAYRLHLQTIRQQVEADWQAWLPQIEAEARSKPAQQQFHDIVTSRFATSAICYDREGSVTYPALTSVPVDESLSDPRWAAATRLENQISDFEGAHALYAQIAEEAHGPAERVIALQAQVRCLLKQGEDERAVALVQGRVSDDSFEVPAGRRARAVVANIELMAMEHLGSGAEFNQLAERLLRRVTDYGANGLEPAQRLFMMKRLNELVPKRMDPLLLRAEDAAAQVVASRNPIPAEGVLHDTPVPDLWQITTPQRQLTLLFEPAHLVGRIQRVAAESELPPGMVLNVIPPTESRQAPELLSSSLGIRFPGWRLSLSLRDAEHSDNAAVQSSRLYWWTGFLVVLFTSLMGLVIARALRHQLRLANLKNDLVGTVSHELKTPLASMRLLVETLLDEEKLEEQTTREYLQLIANENTRLSRLIDNFLTFTRIDQGRYAFEFRALAPAEVIDAAIVAAGERFHSPGCELNATIDERLPDIDGDLDALVTVLLNLLDNAYKYSSEPRQIAVRAFEDQDAIRIDVSDNGIGLSRSAARRVFQRFYQVDQSLAREGRGCGLGLNIVDYIVRAHNGSVNVQSTPGVGSTFSIRLPPILTER